MMLKGARLLQVELARGCDPGAVSLELHGNIDEGIAPRHRETQAQCDCAAAARNGLAADRKDRKTRRVEQRLAEHVVQRSAFRTLVDVAGKIRAFLTPHRRIVDQRRCHRHLEPQAGVRQRCCDGDPAARRVQGDDVVVAQIRQRSGTVHQQADFR
jgi:hypothetical protein